MTTTSKNGLLNRANGDEIKEVLKRTPDHILNYNKHVDTGGTTDGYAYSIEFDIRDKEANKKSGVYVGETKRPFLSRLEEHIEKGIEQKVDKMSGDNSLDPDKLYIYNTLMIIEVRSVNKNNIPTDKWSLKQELSYQESKIGHSKHNDPYFDVILGAK